MNLLKAIMVSTFFSMGMAQAATIVKCTGEYQSKPEIIEVKISQGQIVEFSKNKMARVTKGDYVSGLAQDTTEYGYEWINSLKGRNGAYILEMGTTADSFKIAISQDLARASFEYRDLGSGSGNHRFTLTYE